MTSPTAPNGPGNATGERVPDNSTQEREEVREPNEELTPSDNEVKGPDDSQFDRDKK